MKRAALSAMVLSSLLSGAALADPDGKFGLGNGQGGAFTSPGTIDNSATSLFANAPGGSTTITVVDASPFTSGDLIMLWEPGGLSQPSGGSSVTLAGNQTGTRELARIEGISSNTLTITTSDNGSGIPLQNTFTASRHVQVLKVPEFTTVTISSGTVSPTPWSASTHTGGIIAFLSQGAVTINGTLSANGAGFNGGAVTVFNYVAGACNDQDVPNPNNGEGQTRGEGVAGNTDSINGKSQGFGNVANGGGAGNCVQNGGGGGGNAGAGGSGGGGPDGSNQFPGNGGALINYSGVSLTSQITMGGGGGAGNQKTSGSTSGRSGGGVIWFRGQSLAGSGTISADGGTSPASPGIRDGQGGGGAGGSIYIRLAGTNSFCGAGTLSASGSAGLDAPTIPNPTPKPVGAGGGGGGGRMFIQDDDNGCASIDVSVLGGLAGSAGGPNKGPGDDGSVETAPATRYCSTDGVSTPACSAPNPACLTTTNTCVECVDDSTCLTNPDVKCNSSTNKCVQCLTNAHCPASAPVCDANVCKADCDGSPGDDCSRFASTTHCETNNVSGKHGQCVECLTTSQCPGDALPHCSSSDVCVVCTGNSDCSSGHGVKTLCDNPAGSGACVQCKSNADCASDSAPVCSGGLCVVCSGGNGGETACNTALHSNQHCATSGANNGKCVACADNSHCASDSNPVCDTSTNACTPCSGSNGGEAACNTALHSTQHCATSGVNNGKCVACLNDPHCSGITPACKTSDNTCRECTASNLTQCLANKPVYSGSNLCAASCTQDSPDCSRFGSATPHCETDSNPFTGQCVKCRAGLAQINSQCGSALLPFCDPASDNCVKCTQGGNGQCEQFGVTSVCDPFPAGSGACVGCLTDVDCASPTAPHCSSQSCTGCDSNTVTHGDESCSRFGDAGVPACQPGDGITQDPGECHQCSFFNTSLCTGSTPACNFIIGGCQLCTITNGDMGAQSQGCTADANGQACQGSGVSVFCGCTTDADCGSATSGRICDGVTHLCADGCARAPTRNDCPSGQFCSSNDMTGLVTGVCTMSCQFGSDCATNMPTMPFCINVSHDDAGVDAGTMGRCAGCRNDGDCGGATPVCEPTLKICVQCTSTEFAACSAAATGAICLPNETCGCTDDSQCGAADSGRICDLITTHKCTTGCRVPGGNGCPAGQICDGAGLVPGKCVPFVDMAVNIPDASEPDLSVPIDMTSNNFSLKGGGCSGCAVGGASEVSLGGLLLLALAAVALRKRPRRRPAAPNFNESQGFR